MEHFHYSYPLLGTVAIFFPFTPQYDLNFFLWIFNYHNSHLLTAPFHPPLSLFFFTLPSSSVLFSSPSLVLPPQMLSGVNISGRSPSTQSSMVSLCNFLCNQSSVLCPVTVITLMASSNTSWLWMLCSGYFLQNKRRFIFFPKDSRLWGLLVWQLLPGVLERLT